MIRKIRKMIKKYKKESILVCALLAAAGLLFAGNLLLFSKPAAKAEVSVDGVVVAKYPLSGRLETTITGYRGGENHLNIRDGEAWIDTASCPDKVCVHQGKISKNGQIIVCLPNRVIVKITGGEAD